MKTITEKYLKDKKIKEWELKNNGILLSAIRYPTVPLGSSRLRICLNVNHSIADLENLAKVLKSYA